MGAREWQNPKGVDKLYLMKAKQVRYPASTRRGGNSIKRWGRLLLMLTKYWQKNSAKAEDMTDSLTLKQPGHKLNLPLKILKRQ